MLQKVGHCRQLVNQRAGQQVVFERSLTICWMLQALAAACKTVNPVFLVHSLHTYFLRAGNPESMYMYQLLTFYIAIPKRYARYVFKSNR